MTEERYHSPGQRPKKPKYITIIDEGGENEGSIVTGQDEEIYLQQRSGYYGPIREQEMWAEDLYNLGVAIEAHLETYHGGIAFSPSNRDDEEGD